MRNNSTIDSLKAMRFSAMAAELERQMQDSSTYNEAGNGLPFFQGKSDFGDIYPTVRMWCSEPIKIAQEKDILIRLQF